MKEIKRISITDAAVESIKELIESRQLEIGEKLPTEAQFCEQLKVSRTSIREAIRVLQALGYVILIPGKGAFVASYSPKSADSWFDVDNAQFNDFMEVRMAIETLAVRLSVERAAEKQIAELDEIHQSFIKANARCDMVSMIMIDELFHTKIVEFSNNLLLSNINKQVLNCFRTYRSSSFSNSNVYSNAIVPHARILECFHQKDASRAVVEMRRHLEITANDMEMILGKAYGGKSIVKEEAQKD